MREWVFTVPPGQFNIMAALIPGAYLDWPTFSKFKFEEGDYVFFYASSPVMQMVGKLRIEKTGLDFSKVNPRNDLRKWPRTYSKIPWMRLYVEQCAPVPYKPLERDSLYYHTGFKPSPYPKLLHAEEHEYVWRAFDQAMDFKADVEENNGLAGDALAEIEKRKLFSEIAASMRGGHVTCICFDKEENIISLSLQSRNDDAVKLLCSGLRRVAWNYDRLNDSIGTIRLKKRDIYLQLNIDSADLDIICDKLDVN